MSDTSRNTTLIILLIVGSITLCISLGVYVWVFKEVRSTVSQVSLLSDEAELLATKNAHTQTVRRIVRDTEQEQQELNTYFITEQQLVSFLEELEALGQGSGVAVRSVEVGKTIDKDDRLTPLTLSLSTTGTLQEVFQVVALLETLPKALHINTVRMTQDATTLLWEGSFNVVVIQIKPPTET